MQPTTMLDINELERNTRTITTPEDPKSLAEVAGEVPPKVPASETQPNVTPTNTSVAISQQTK